MTTDPPRNRPILTPHAAALFATVFTWPLLFVGGLVTTYRVGMAVPDWPTTFGINMFLYDMSNAAWGVLVEHGHRLYGAAVGIGCVALAVWLSLASGRRAWAPLAGGMAAALALSIALRAAGPVDPLMAGIQVGGPVSLGLAAWFALVRASRLAALAWLAVLAVIAQGAIGGLRVRMNSTDLAALHGCTGQLFFAGMVALCVLTGRGPTTDKPPPSDDLDRPFDPASPRLLSFLAAALIYSQIVAGAWLRHYSAGLQVHTTMALAVVGLVAMLGHRVLSRRDSLAPLVPSTRALVCLTGFQILLGVASWWMLRPFDGIPKGVDSAQALVRTMHQANGALVLAAAVVLAMRARTAPAPARLDDRVPIAARATPASL